MKKWSQLFALPIIFLCFSQLYCGVSDYPIPKLNGDYVFGSDKVLSLTSPKLNMQDGLMDVAPDDELAWRISGIVGGKYYIQCLRGDLSPFMIPFGLFINGKGVVFTEYTEPVPYRDTSLAVMQAGPIEISNGDEVRWRFSRRTFFGGFSLSKDKIKAPMSLWTDSVVPEDYFRVSGTFRGTENLPGDASFKFSLLNVKGKRDTFSVKCVILDCFQRNLDSSERKIELENRGVFENELFFRTGGSDRYSAIVTVTDSADYQDSFTEEIIVNRVEGARKKIWVEDEWKWLSIPYDGTFENFLTVTPPGFKGVEKLQNTALPLSLERFGQEARDVAWFGAKIQVPANFAGKRYFMHFGRPAFGARVFLNGREVGTCFDPVSPFEMEVTGTFLPGQENEIIIGMRDEMAATEMSGFYRKWRDGNCWSEFKFRTGLGEIYFYSTGEFPMRNVLVKPSFRRKELMAEVSMPEKLPEDDMILSGKVFLAGMEVFYFDRKKLKSSDAGRKFVFCEKWYNPPLWGPNEFSLLELAMELRDSKGTMLDQVRTRFGFGELYAEGKALMWNGVKVKFGSRPYMNPPSSDLNVTAETIFTHYPAEKDALRKGDVYFPEAAYWRSFRQTFQIGMKVPAGMCRCVESSTGDSQVIWGYRPIIVDETSWTGFLNSPDGLTEFFSDKVYAGFDALVRAHDLANIWFVRGHRDAEASAVMLCKSATANPDLAAIPRIDINILQRYNKFFAGERVVYDVNLNRDIFDSADIVYRWNLKKGDGNSIGSVEKTLHFGPSEMKRERINLRLPEVGKITKLTLEISLRDYESSEMLMVEELPITVYPADVSAAKGFFPWFSLSEEENKIRTDLKTAVLDPQDEVLPLLEGMLENSQNLEKINGLTKNNLSDVDLLVICEDSGIDKIEGAGILLMDFVKNGGQIFLLKQSSCQKWLPMEMPLTDSVFSNNCSFRREHPLLNGIAGDELSYWYPNHKVIEKSYVKPISGNYKVIVESGGPDGLVYAGLIELILGKGRIICSQLRMTEDLDVNPVPFRLWKNIFKYCATKQVEPKSAGYIGTGISAAKKALLAGKVSIKDIAVADLKNFSTAILDANTELSDKDITALKNFASAGGVLFIQGTTPDNVGKISKICGSDVKVFRPGPLQWTGRAVRLGVVPEMAGLTNFEFFWKVRPLGDGDMESCYNSGKTAIAGIGDWVVKSDAGESLLFPSYIVRINSGSGKIILDNVNWANPKQGISDCCSRILCTLMTNADVKIGQ